MSTQPQEPLAETPVSREEALNQGLAALEAENEQLREALRSRITIEQAKGAVSARLGTTPEVAFELIRGLARSQRRNLQEYAAHLVAHGGRLDY